MSDNTDVLLLLGKIDGKVDLMLTRSVEHDRRISALESWKNRAAGIGAFAAFLITTALAGLAYVLPK